MAKKQSNKGIATYYRDKLQKPVTINLTKTGHARLKAAQAAHTRSRSDIFERLLEKHGAELDFPPREEAPIQTEETQPAQSAQL